MNKKRYTKRDTQKIYGKTHIPCFSQHMTQYRSEGMNADPAAKLCGFKTPLMPRTHCMTQACYLNFSMPPLCLSQDGKNDSNSLIGSWQGWQCLNMYIKYWKEYLVHTECYFFFLLLLYYYTRDHTKDKPFSPMPQFSWLLNVSWVL